MSDDALLPARTTANQAATGSSSLARLTTENLQTGKLDPIVVEPSCPLDSRACRCSDGALGLEGVVSNVTPAAARRGLALAVRGVGLVVVGCALKVAVQKYRIVSIDCPNSTFSVVFSLHLRWFDPTLSEDDKAASKAWDAGWVPQWLPRIDFVNETEVVEKMRENFDTDAAGHVRYFGRYRGTFYEPFLLHRFPLDRHFLEIRITTTWPVQVMRYTAFKNYANTLETFSLAAWRVPHSDALDVNIDPMPSTLTRYAFSRANLRCKVERAHMYFFWNAFLPFFLICILVIITFLFDTGDLGGRLQVSLTLLLTAVAFKFVVSSSLPQVEYLTIIDRYFLVGIFYIFLVSVENAVVKTLSLYDPTDADTVDRICLWVFGGVWVVAHLAIFTIIMCNPRWLFQRWTEVQSGF